MRYRDQFLNLHRLSLRKYELSCLRTGSLRDQILRAHLSVQRLAIELRLIRQADGRGLIVLGGGAAGVAAALAAANAGINVALVEQNGRLFDVQKRVWSRRVDPLEFDWPQPWWRPEVDTAKGTRGCNRWPQDPAVPLTMTAQAANDQALIWERVFEQWLTDHPRGTPGKGWIDVLTGVDARALTFKETGASIMVAGLPSHALHTEFGVALSCIGFGGENVSIAGYSGQAYKGFEFWDEDPINDTALGVSGGVRPVRALVSGGGDGAMQDFLRITTGDFGRALYERMEQRFSAADPMLTPEQTLRLMSAEDSARRAHAWRSRKTRPTKVLRAWNDEYDDVVDEVWRGLSVAQKRAMIGCILRPHVSATWVLRDDEPDFCYGLNRFLILFVLRLIEFAKLPASAQVASHAPQWAGGFGGTVMRRQVVCDVRCADPGVNLSDPDASHGVPKTVDVVSVGTKRSQIRASAACLGDFHVIVVRHGANGRPLFRAGAPIPEQLAPYEVPR